MAVKERANTWAVDRLLSDVSWLAKYLKGKLILIYYDH